MRIGPIAMLAAAFAASVGCDRGDNGEYESDGRYIECEIDASIPKSYGGQSATDSDTPGSDADIYWEAGDYSNVVKVTYNGGTADVTTSYDGVKVVKSGADVALDFVTPGGRNAEVVVSGKTADGSLKVYSSNRIKLTLDGAEIVSGSHPAVNVQCDDKVFVHLSDGKSNVLSDASSYVADIYYVNPEVSSAEFRTGCLSVAGDAVFSGKGPLKVTGNFCNAVATAGFLWIRKGVTVAVLDSRSDGIFVSGGDYVDEDGDKTGFRMNGGLVFTKVSSDGCSALKSLAGVKVKGGELQMYSTGNGAFVEAALDVNAPAALVADGVMKVTSGTVTAKASGKGGTAMRVGGFSIGGGEVTSIASGPVYKYHNLKCIAAGMISSGSVSVTEGKLNVCSVTESDGADGLYASGDYVQTAGDVYIYAKGAGLTSAAASFSGGTAFLYSHTSSTVQADMDLTIDGGTVVAQASKAAFATGSSGKFILDGGTVLGLYNVSSLPKSYSQAYSYSTKVPANMDSFVCISEDGVNAVCSYKVPRSSAAMSIIYSSPELATGTTYHCYRCTGQNGGTLLDRILYKGGTVSGSTDIGLMSTLAPAN